LRPEAENYRDLSSQQKRALLASLLREQKQRSTVTHPLSHGQKALWLLQRSVLFPIPTRERVTPAAAGFPQVEEHVLTTEDGEKIILWHMPAKPGRPVVLYFHGNGDFLAGFFGRFHDLIADGTGFVVPAYRGYAGSDAGENFFRTGYAVDVLNLIASVKTLPQANAESIGVWGHSMGGGVSLEVAVLTSPGVRGVVLYGPMSGDMAANYYRIAWFRGWATPGPDWPMPPETAPESYTQLSPLNYLRDIQVPIRIHHGYRDDQVPYDWSLRLNTALTLYSFWLSLKRLANALTRSLFAPVIACHH